MRAIKIKPVFLISVLLLLQFALKAQIRLAITNFENQTDEILLDGWQRNLPDYLGAELGNSEQIILLERNRLKELFAEMHLALSGFIEDSALVNKIGRMAGADVIISGVITKFEKRYVILTHITRVKTTEVMVEKVEAPDNRHFRQMVRLLANNIRFRLTGQGKYLNKASLKRYPTRYFLLSTVVSALIAGALKNSSDKAYQDYHNATSLKDMDRFYDRANGLHKLSGLFFTMAGAGLLGSVYCWIKNMKQADLKAGSAEKFSVRYQWQFRRKGAGFAVQIRF